MSKFADPPINTDFNAQGQPAPTDPWEKWFQAVSNQFTAAPQSFLVTHANRLKLTQLTNGSMAKEIDTGHIFIWFGSWTQLI